MVLRIGEVPCSSLLGRLVRSGLGLALGHLKDRAITIRNSAETGTGTARLARGLVCGFDRDAEVYEDPTPQAHKQPTPRRHDEYWACRTNNGFQTLKERLAATMNTQKNASPRR